MNKDLNKLLLFLAIICFITSSCILCLTDLFPETQIFKPRLPVNALMYDNTVYEMLVGRIYSLNNEQYQKNESFKVQMHDQFYRLVVVYKLHGYVCDGAQGPYQVLSYHVNDLETHKYREDDRHYVEHSLQKGSYCYPYGGLEPIYFIIIPYSCNFNDYYLTKKFNEEFANKIEKKYEIQEWFEKHASNACPDLEYDIPAGTSLDQL